MSSAYEMFCTKCGRFWTSEVREEVDCPKRACGGRAGSQSARFVPPEEIARRHALKKAIAKQKGVPA